MQVWVQSLQKVHIRQQVFYLHNNLCSFQKMQNWKLISNPLMAGKTYWKKEENLEILSTPQKL
jgi:hypothetical protein